MSDTPTPLNRRQTLARLGLAGAALTPVAALAQGPGAGPGETSVTVYPTTAALQAAPPAAAGAWATTSGFFAPADGGDSLYAIVAPQEGLAANGADVLELANGLLAVLHAPHGVGYRQFGARSDGESDDGVAIKLAHTWANAHGVPVINLRGEYWIKDTYRTGIRTPVQWGQSIFHIDERYNTPNNPRWVVENDRPTVNLLDNEAVRTALIKELRPGVAVIGALAEWAGHLFVVQDAEDRIGLRQGYAGNRGWAREELFYVEEEGRILGDIAWPFTNLTMIHAVPCSENWLVIEGGVFYFSGDTPAIERRGYTAMGMNINRSRTVVREQWCGLEPGRRDTSIDPRNGIYSLGRVYDVTLENIRAMPWEKNRKPPAKPVPEGTYGLGGSRMLNCTFRNLTAEAGPIAWGVFGTNINKNFRIENCRLNRVDVHFYCSNLTILDSEIGLKGISVTGGGELRIENTVRRGNNLVAFRQDYGARWDGPIRIRNCTLRPVSNGGVGVLTMRPANFDYRYPLGFGRSLRIEGLTIDYSGVPGNTAACWMLSLAQFSQVTDGPRLFFPQDMLFRDVRVVGRERGVRLFQLRQPWGFDLGQPGGDGTGGTGPNAQIVCERVALDQTSAAAPGGLDEAHLVLGGTEPVAYLDDRALYPEVIFTDCPNVALWLGHCAAAVRLTRCGVSQLTAQQLAGSLELDHCRLQPRQQHTDGPAYDLTVRDGVSFTSCTLAPPVINGELSPGQVAAFGFLVPNERLAHGHLNTTPTAELRSGWAAAGIALTPEYLARLRAQHPLEGD